MSNQTYYVKCATQEERDSLLDYAVIRGAHQIGDRYSFSIERLVLLCEDKSVASVSTAEPNSIKITPDSFRRKVRKLWPSKVERGIIDEPPRVHKPKAPNADPKPTQLDRIEAKLDTILSGATFMQELDKNARQLQEMKEIGEKWDAEGQGLQPGDYTDASKEVADALTAMGFNFFYRRYEGQSVVVWYESLMCLDMDRELDTHKTYHDPAEFLRRAAVTAKEIGLVPVEPWVPKVGGWVVVTSAHHHPAVPLCSVVKVKAEDWVDGLTWDVIGPDGNAWPYLPDQLRPATDAEIAAHLAEQEERANAEKIAKLKPGVRVQTESGQGIYVRMDMACIRPYLVLRDGLVTVTNHRLSDITVIEQP